MATFVLVHGAMQGGWCWADVRRSLTGRGHDVYTPTLTGQGDRRRELTRATGVDHHVTDIAELLPPARPVERPTRSPAGTT
jgi:pimeloyl-ACP methyl ester carboxylesterase